MEKIQIHFVMLAVGEVLKRKSIVTPEDVRDYIVNEDTFTEVRLRDCRLALSLLEGAGFINQLNATEYRKPIQKW